MGGEGRGGEGRGGECLVMQICLNYLISFNSFGRQKSNLGSSICNPGQRIPDVD